MMLLHRLAPVQMQHKIHILEEHPRDLLRIEQPEHVINQAGFRSGNASLIAGHAQVLAWEARAHQVRLGRKRGELRDIGD